jgi:hypothetical protein
MTPKANDPKSQKPLVTAPTPPSATPTKLRQISRFDFSGQPIFHEHMKNVFKFCALFFYIATAGAQGTIQFGALLDGAHAVPPNGSSMLVGGLFSLEGMRFQGSVFLDDPYPFDATSIELFRSTVSSELGESLATFFPSGRIDAEGGAGSGTRFSVDLALSPTQIEDLFAGRFYVNIDTFAFPNGEIRGQIVVPEPSTIALLALGGLLLLRSRRQ